MLAGKLDEQDADQTKLGRTLANIGAEARIFHEVCKAGLANIVRVDLKSGLFTYDIDQTAQQRGGAMDGKLLLVSNVPDLSARQIVAR